MSKKQGRPCPVDPEKSHRPPHLRRRNAEALFKQFAEVVCIVVAYQRGNLLNAAIVSLFQQFLGLLQTNVDQVSDGGVPGLRLEDLGDIEGT